MTNILELLSGSLSKETVAQLDKEVGVNDEKKTSAALDQITKMMLAGINKNTETEEGLRSLNNALERDHHGEVFDDVAGNLLRPEAKSTQGNERTLNGAGILQHVLGGNESNVFNSLSDATGMDKGQLMSLAIKVAPLIMGALGKAKNEGNLGESGLDSLLKGVMGSLTSGNSAQASFLESLLGQGKGGKGMDGVVGMGKKLLGNIFGK